MYAYLLNAWPVTIICIFEEPTIIFMYAYSFSMVWVVSYSYYDKFNLATHHMHDIKVSLLTYVASYNMHMILKHTI